MADILIVTGKLQATVEADSHRGRAWLDKNMTALRKIISINREFVDELSDYMKSEGLNVDIVTRAERSKKY